MDLWLSTTELRHQQLVRRIPPLRPEDKTKERVLPSHATLKDQTCLLVDKLLATGGRGFSTSLIAMETIFQE